MRKYPLVLVEWHDTITYSDWKDVKEVQDKPCDCVSIGWKIKANRGAITLSSMRSKDDCNHRTVIPRGCIKSIKVIKGE